MNRRQKDQLQTKELERHFYLQSTGKEISLCSSLHPDLSKGQPYILDRAGVKSMGFGVRTVLESLVWDALTLWPQTISLNPHFLINSTNSYGDYKSESQIYWSFHWHIHICGAYSDVWSPVCVCDSFNSVQSLSCIQILDCQVPLSMEFPRQEDWSGLHFLLQGVLPTQGWNLGLLHCRQILYRLSHQGRPWSSVLLYKQVPQRQ